jgi:hypothetical protein
VHQNPPTSYHSTVFHTGQPSDFRAASPAEVAAEVEVARALVGATPCYEVGPGR